jgi:hypothetical protein
MHILFFAQRHVPKGSGHNKGHRWPVLSEQENCPSFLLYRRPFIVQQAVWDLTRNAEIAAGP